MFADRPAPDLIVTVGGPAALFARSHRQQLFPERPLLFGAVDERWFRGGPLGENESAVAVANDFPRLIDDILQVLPETRQVFVVAGSGPIGRFWRKELESEFVRFRDRVTFIWSDELSFPDVLRRCASLPAHSAIVYITLGTDAQGGTYGDEQVLSALHTTANAPLFGAQNALLGHALLADAQSLLRPSFVIDSYREQHQWSGDHQEKQLQGQSVFLGGLRQERPASLHRSPDRQYRDAQH